MKPVESNKKSVQYIQYDTPKQPLESSRKRSRSGSISPELDLKVVTDVENRFRPISKTPKVSNSGPSLDSFVVSLIKPIPKKEKEKDVADVLQTLTLCDVRTNH